MKHLHLPHFRPAKQSNFRIWVQVFSLSDALISRAVGTRSDQEEAFRWFTRGPGPPPCLKLLFGSSPWTPPPHTLIPQSPLFLSLTSLFICFVSVFFSSRLCRQPVE